MDYSDKTNEEIHADINKGLINGQKAIDKIKAKKKKTIDDNKMIDNMDNMITAYIALANNTFLSEFTSLEDIQIELNNRIAQQTKQVGEKNSANNLEEVED